MNDHAVFRIVTRFSMYAVRHHAYLLAWAQRLLFPLFPLGRTSGGSLALLLFFAAFGPRFPV